MTRTQQQQRRNEEEALDSNLIHDDLMDMSFSQTVDLDDHLGTNTSNIQRSSNKHTTEPLLDQQQEEPQEHHPSSANNNKTNNDSNESNSHSLLPDEVQEEDLSDEDNETQSLLKLSHENKALKASLADLQDQVQKLVQAQSVSNQQAISTRNIPTRTTSGASSRGRPSRSTTSRGRPSRTRSSDGTISRRRLPRTSAGLNPYLPGASGHRNSTSRRTSHPTNNNSTPLDANSNHNNNNNPQIANSKRQSRASTSNSLSNAAKAGVLVDGGLALGGMHAGANNNHNRSTTSPQPDDSDDESSSIDPNFLEQHLSEDSFGFLLATPVCSAPFGLACLVLLFQIGIYALMTSNLVAPENPKKIFEIPSNVTQPVWICQIVAIIISVVTQDDIRTGLDMLREGYTSEMRGAFPHSNGTKFAASVASRLMGGSLGLIVNFLLIVTSETVIDLLLNFTALAFVGQLDEVTFFLCKQGFAGKRCLHHATAITEAYYYVPRSFVQGRKTIMMVVILIGNLVAWGIVRYHQTRGEYLCSTVLSQMGDEMRPELGTFAGLYDIQAPKGRIFSSQHVEYHERNGGHSRFAFCTSQSFWTFQVKETTDSDFPSSPCDGWYARSSVTDTYDLTIAALDGWFVRDDFSRETMLEPFFLHCFECGYTLNSWTSDGQQCNGRGTCSNAICTCDAGWYGMRCDLLAPCPTLTLDARTSGTLAGTAVDRAEAIDGSFDILTYTTTDEDNQVAERLVEAYHRPVYVGHLMHGMHMIIFFSGRRWVVTHTGLININHTEFVHEEDGRDEIIRFFNENFHAHWNRYAVEFMSEPMDTGTPSDANSPAGLLWFEAEVKGSINETAIQAPNEARAVDARVLCGVCDDEHNPCQFDGVCMQGTCECAVGAHGSLCEKSPVNNGRCDANYNIPYFEFDGGDCCDSTCLSTPEYTCGEELNGYVNFGYYHCRLPPRRWQPLRMAHIDGDPLSLAGYSVAISQSGTLMAMGEPEAHRVKIYDKDGAMWILRQTLEGVPDSHFGMSVVLSAGPVHWRNNPYFRAPLLLGIGIAKKEEPFRVELYRCGNDEKCKLLDQWEDVAGKEGPEAYDISNDATVFAYGREEKVEVYKVTGDFYQGNQTTRPVVIVAANQNQTDARVRAVRLSEHGDILAVATELVGKTKVSVQEWSGQSYNSRGDTLLETEGEVLQRQFAISDDGSVVAVGLSKCPSMEISIFAWNETAAAWQQRPSPDMTQENCENTFLAWSVALVHDGRMLFVGAYPDSDVVTAFEWIEAANTWQMVGDPINGHAPGSSSSIATSSDGSHLVIGLPFAGKNEAGIVSTYSLPMSLCPIDASHHFRMSLTTDYDPESILWSLEEAKTGEVMMSGGPYQFSVATLVEEQCLDTKSCHVFTIYNTKWQEGLQRPGRFDLFLDGGDLDRNSFQGIAKRVHFGNQCMQCPTGMRKLQMMVHTCGKAEWKIVDNLGIPVLEGQASEATSCEAAATSLQSYYWEEACVDESKCYTFSANHISSPEEGSSELDFLLLFDSDVYIASERGVITSGTANIGTCNA